MSQATQGATNMEDINKTFDSLESLFDSISEEQFTGAASHKVGDWYGTESFEQCQEFAQFGGWDVANEQAEKAVASILATVRDSIKVQPDRLYANVGAMPNVAMFVAGNPSHMIQHVVTPRSGRSKTVRILVNVCTSGGVSTDVMIRRGVAYAALVEVIQSLGYSVDLWVGTAHGCHSRAQRFNSAWNVKNSSGVIDRDRLLFNLANPSNLRRIGFAIMETLTAKERKRFSVPGGYGTVERFTKSFIDSISPDVVSDASIMLGSRGQSDPIGWVIDTLTGLDLIG